MVKEVLLLDLSGDDQPPRWEIVPDGPSHEVDASIKIEKDPEVSVINKVKKKKTQRHVNPKLLTKAQYRLPCNNRTWGEQPFRKPKTDLRDIKSTIEKSFRVLPREFQKKRHR